MSKDTANSYDFSADSDPFAPERIPKKIHYYGEMYEVNGDVAKNTESGFTFTVPEYIQEMRDMYSAAEIKAADMLETLENSEFSIPQYNKFLLPINRGLVADTLKKMERCIPDFAKDAMYEYMGESRNQDTIHKIRAALCCMSEQAFRNTTMYMTQWKMTCDERTNLYQEYGSQDSSSVPGTETAMYTN
eukprot:SAG31_NODE_1280_length_9033_cov_11.049810_5_plen_189_part_00